MLLTLLALVVPSAQLLAQGLDEHSVPEPTLLTRQAMSEQAQLRVIGNEVSVSSRESTATITPVRVRSSDGTRHSGLQLSMQNSEGTDLVYLDVDQATKLRDEFVELRAVHDLTSGCDATSMCVNGIARCRPSQHVVQAYCPTSYSTALGERGIVLATPRSLFRFPDIRPSSFIAAIEQVTTALAQDTTAAKPADR